MKRFSMVRWNSSAADIEANIQIGTTMQIVCMELVNPA